MFFINPPVNPVSVCQVEFWFAGCHTCLLLVTVDFELGPLVAEFGRAQHVTGPEVVWHASGTVHTCRDGYVRHVHASGGYR